MVFLCSLNGLSQQGRPNDTSIAQLKEAIVRLEAIDSNPATPPDVKEVNRGFLQKRREQLNLLLQKRSIALREYLANMKDFLSPEEVATVERSIQDAERAEPNLAETSQATVSPVLDDTSDKKTVFTGTKKPITVTDSIRRDFLKETVQPDALVPFAVNSGGPVRVQEFPLPQDCGEFNSSPKTFSLYEQYVCTMIDDTQKRKSAGKLPIELTGPQFFHLAVILMSQKLRADFLVDAEEARVDKQVGSTSSNSGSTSLVTKGGTPAILGFAVENGALEREISGTTLTFRGNPVGLVEAFANKGFISGFEDDSPATRLLRKSSFAFSFDTSRGSDPGIFTANKQQLSAVSGRFEFINKRDPRNREYKTDWENFLATRAAPFLKVLVDSKDVLIETILGVGGAPDVFKWRDQALEKWYEDTLGELNAAAPGNVETVMRERLTKLPIDELSSETVDALKNFARQFGVYLEGRKRVLDKVAKGTIATLEFTNKREVNAPDTTNFTGIFETAFGENADFTLNGSLTMFNQKPNGLNVGRIRDFQFAAQLDLPFGKPNEAGQFVLSASGKYERLMGNFSTATGLFLPNTDGDLAFGQIKLSIPIKGLGMKLPLSLTFANRTELIKEKTVRANFGFTFDLDTIFAKFKPF
jgi:hypothetical protein